MKLILLITMALIASSAYSQSPDVRFRAAKQKETVEGDLRSAIRMYQEVADSRESSRDLAAQALLRMGRCYEKLGSSESKKAYERVVRQYGDQAQVAGEARQRLAALQPAGEARGELTARLLFHIEERVRSGFDIAGFIENVATDGHTVYRLGLVDPFDQQFNVSLIATDVGTGRKRELFHGQLWPCGLSLSPDSQQLAFSGQQFSPDHITTDVYTIRVDGANLHRVLTSTTERQHAFFMGPWSPDQQELVVSERGAGMPSRIDMVSLSDGSVRPWAQLSATRNATFTERLSLSPDGRFLVYDVPRGEGGERSMCSLRRGSSETSVLNVGQGSNKVLGWYPGGRDLLFASDRRGTVDAFRIRIVDGKAVGEPLLVRTNIGPARSLGFRSNGSFYFINDGLTRSVMAASFDPNTGAITGSPNALTKSLVDSTFTPSWSPDGSTLVYANAPTGMRGELPTLVFQNVATRDERSMPPARDVLGAAPGSAWSSDSQYLYVERYGKDAELGTYQVNVHSGETRRVAPAWCLYPFPGEQALFCNLHGSEGAKQNTIAKHDLTTGSMLALRQVEEGLYPFAPSPDGRFVLYVGSGAKNFQLIPIGDGGRRMLLEAAPGEHLRVFAWLGRDKIAFVRERPGKVSICIRNINSGEEVELKGVDLSRIAVTEGLIPLMNFHPNGHEVVWVSNEGSNELWALENFAVAEHLMSRK